MRTFLINLDRSPERLANMEREFDRVGVAFTRFAGVDALGWEKGTTEAYFRDHPSFSPEERRPHDAGAFLSHFAVWEAVVAEGAPYAAIFEDDVHLALDLQSLLSTAEWIPADADVVRLESNRKMVLTEGRRIGVAPARKIYRALSNTWGAAGYIISRHAAARLIATPPDWHTHIDWFLFKPTRSNVAAGIRRYQIVPAVSIQDSYLNGSEAMPQNTATRTVPVHSPPGRFSWLLPHGKRVVPFKP